MCLSTCNVLRVCSSGHVRLEPWRPSSAVRARRYVLQVSPGKNWGWTTRELPSQSDHGKTRLKIIEALYTSRWKWIWMTGSAISKGILSHVWRLDVIVRHQAIFCCAGLAVAELAHVCAKLRVAAAALADNYQPGSSMLWWARGVHGTAEPIRKEQQRPHVSQMQSIDLLRLRPSI